MRDEYIKYLKSIFVSALANYLAEDYTASFHDEFSYNDEVDINVTIKFLSSALSNGILQYPGEIMLEVKEEFKDNVIKALVDIAEDFTESVITIGSFSYRQYYSTPSVLGVFQNVGIHNKCSISMSFNLISFSNVLMIDPIDGLTIATTDSSSAIRFASFVITYATDTNSTGSLGDAKVKQVGETVGTAFIVTFVPRTNNAIHRSIFGQMVNRTGANKKYTLTLKDYSVSNNLNHTTSIECVIVNASFDQEPNSALPTLQVTFREGDF